MVYEVLLSQSKNLIILIEWGIQYEAHKRVQLRKVFYLILKWFLEYTVLLIFLKTHQKLYISNYRKWSSFSVLNCHQSRIGLN